MTLSRNRPFSFPVPVLVAAVAALRHRAVAAALSSAILATAAGLALTAAAVVSQQRGALAEARVRFDRQVERALTEVARRFNQPVYGLHGARGVYAAEGRPLKRAEFRAYVESRDLAVEFPGVRGFGFAQRVARAQLESFVAAERADGASQFAVQTSGAAADLYVVKFIEPLSQNYPAWGLDFGAEAVRREAVERAADTGAATLSGRVKLAQDGRQGAGFLYLVPVFRDGTDPVTPAQRRAAMVGLLYSPIVVQELLMPAVPAVEGQIDFQLYDGTDVREAVFDSRRDVAVAPAVPTNAEPRVPLFSNASTLVIGGRTLALRCETTPAFEATLHRATERWTALGGSLLSALLGLTVWLLAAGRARAQALAQAMTADLDRLAKVAERTSNAVVITDARRRITWVNEGFTRMTGFSKDEALGRSPGEMLQCEESDAATVAAMRLALDAGRGFQCRLLNRGKQGHPFWVEFEIQPLRDAQGALLGFMAIASDVTEVKQAAEQLLEERARLANILEGTNVGTWEWNVQTGEYRCNERWAQMLGRSLTELAPLGERTWFELAHPDDVDRAGELLRSHFAHKLDYYEFEGRLRHRDGHWVWVLDRGRVSSWLADGRPEWMSGTQMDISQRKQAEGELRASRIFLDRAGRLAGVGGWQVDLATKAIVWSEETRRIHEVPPDYTPTLEKGIRFYAPEARPAIERAVAIAVEHGLPWDLELPFITALGRPIWVRAIGEVEREDGKPVRLVGAFQDVTARRAMEVELRRSDAVHRSILDNLPCGLSVFDGELQLVSYNAQFRQLLDLPPDLLEQPGTPLAEVLDYNARRGEYGADGEATVRRKLERARLPTPHAYERVRPDGTALEIRGAPMPGGGFVTTYTDVTERKRTEAALYRTTALLQSVLQAASEIAVIATGTDLVVTVFNRGAERLLGYAAAEVVGSQTPALFAAPDEAAQRCAELSQELGRPIRGPAAVLAAELLGREQSWRFVRKDGSRVEVSLVVTAVRTEAGELSGYLGIAHDVTRRREVEDSLRQSTRRAEEASLAKSRFVANMSHEIRTPMNAVLGMLTLLQRTALNAHQLDYVDKSQRAARSLLRLIDDILDFSKADAGKMTLDPQPFRIATLLEDVTVVLAALVAAKPVALRVELDPSVPHVLIGDGLRLQQVLVNLGGNAVKFTARGKVVLRVRTIERDAEAVRLEVGVQDSGIGIDSAHLTHIFDGFSQAEASTTRRFGGTGLGLAISRRLVELMGGTLGVHSTPGVGSRFHFELRLPIAAAEALCSPPRGDTAPEGTLRLDGMRVLLVEDNANNRQIARELLEGEGAVVSLAENGVEGAHAALRAVPPFDAVLMDIQMPLMDGYGATALIRQVHGASELPIVAMTANTTKADREACLSAGMNDHLGKPFELDQLVATLRRHAGRAAAPTKEPLARSAGNAHEPPRAPSCGPVAGASPEALALAAAQGIDLAGALRRLGQRVPVYLRSLQAFVGELGGLPEELRALLDAGRLVDASGRMHALKGVAGTLGAQTLALAAARAEDGWSRPGAEPGSSVRVLEDILIAARGARDALAEIGSVLTATELPAATATPAPPAAEPSDDASLSRGLGRLAALLDQSDLRALDLQARLRSEHSARWPQALDEAIAAFDFAGAATLCHRLIESLDG